MKYFFKKKPPKHNLEPATDEHLLIKILKELKINNYFYTKINLNQGNKITDQSNHRLKIIDNIIQHIDLIMIRYF